MASAASVPRRNRTSAERRAQELRSSTRAWSKLLKAQASLEHRGNQVSHAFSNLVHIPSSSSTVPGPPQVTLDTISAQLSALQSDVGSLLSRMSILEASSRQPAPKLGNIVDPGTYERLRSNPWTCSFCKFTVLDDDPERSMKKSRHMRQHLVSPASTAPDSTPPVAAPLEPPLANDSMGPDSNHQQQPEPSATAATVATDRRVRGNTTRDQRAPAAADVSVVSPGSSSTSVEPYISLVIHNLENSSMFPCQFRRSRPLEHLFIQHCQAFSTSRAQAAYIISDRNLFLQGTETPDSLGLVDGTTIQFSKIDDSRDGLFW